jgi:hypothetical protein
VAFLSTRLCRGVGLPLLLVLAPLARPPVLLPIPLRLDRWQAQQARKKTSPKTRQHAAPICAGTHGSDKGIKSRRVHGLAPDGMLSLVGSCGDRDRQGRFSQPLAAQDLATGRS